MAMHHRRHPGGSNGTNPFTGRGLPMNSPYREDFNNGGSSHGHSISGMVKKATLILLAFAAFFYIVSSGVVEDDYHAPSKSSIDYGKKSGNSEEEVPKKLVLPPRGADESSFGGGGGGYDGGQEQGASDNDNMDYGGADQEEIGGFNNNNNGEEEDAAFRHDGDSINASGSNDENNGSNDSAVPKYSGDNGYRDGEEGGLDSEMPPMGGDNQDQDEGVQEGSEDKDRSFGGGRLAGDMDGAEFNHISGREDSREGEGEDSADNADNNLSADGEAPPSRDEPLPEDKDQSADNQFGRVAGEEEGRSGIGGVEDESDKDDAADGKSAIAAAAALLHSTGNSSDQAGDLVTNNSNDHNDVQHHANADTYRKEEEGGGLSMEKTIQEMDNEGGEQQHASNIAAPSDDESKYGHADNSLVDRAKSGDGRPEEDMSSYQRHQDQMAIPRVAEPAVGGGSGDVPPTERDSGNDVNENHVKKYLRSGSPDEKAADAEEGHSKLVDEQPLDFREVSSERKIDNSLYNKEEYSGTERNPMTYEKQYSHNAKEHSYYKKDSVNEVVGEMKKSDDDAAAKAKSRDVEGDPASLRRHQDQMAIPHAAAKEPAGSGDVPPTENEEKISHQELDDHLDKIHGSEKDDDVAAGKDSSYVKNYLRSSGGGSHDEKKDVATDLDESSNLGEKQSIVESVGEAPESKIDSASYKEKNSASTYEKKYFTDAKEPENSATHLISEQDSVLDHKQQEHSTHEEETNENFSTYEKKHTDDAKVYGKKSEEDAVKESRDITHESKSMAELKSPSFGLLGASIKKSDAAANSNSGDEVKKEAPADEKIIAETDEETSDIGEKKEEASMDAEVTSSKLVAESKKSGDRENSADEQPSNEVETKLVDSEKAEVSGDAELTKKYSGTKDYPSHQEAKSERGEDQSKDLANMGDSGDREEKKTKEGGALNVATVVAKSEDGDVLKSEHEEKRSIEKDEAPDTTAKDPGANVHYNEHSEKGSPEGQKSIAEMDESSDHGDKKISGKDGALPKVEDEASKEGASNDKPADAVEPTVEESKEGDASKVVTAKEASVLVEPAAKKLEERLASGGETPSVEGVPSKEDDASKDRASNDKSAAASESAAKNAEKTLVESGGETPSVEGELSKGDEAAEVDKLDPLPEAGEADNAEKGESAVKRDENTNGEGQSDAANLSTRDSDEALKPEELKSQEVIAKEEGPPPAAEGEMATKEDGKGDKASADTTIDEDKQSELLASDADAENNGSPTAQSGLLSRFRKKVSDAEEKAPDSEEAAVDDGEESERKSGLLSSLRKNESKPLQEKSDLDEASTSDGKKKGLLGKFTVKRKDEHDESAYVADEDSKTATTRRLAKTKNIVQL